VLKYYLHYLEGGNVFRETDRATEQIKKEYIDSTVKYFTEALKKVFPKVKFEFSYLGSTGQKDISRDIDLLFDVKKVIENETPKLDDWGLSKDEYKKTYDQFVKRAKTAYPYQLQVRAVLKMIGDKFKSNNSEIQVSTKSIGSNELHFSAPQIDKNRKLANNVQIDLNVGEPEWLNFSYSSLLQPESNVKGLHKTQLIVHLFANKGYVFKHHAGIFHKETNKQVAKTPAESIALLNKLYNFHLDENNSKSYSGIMKQIHSLPKEEQDKVFDIYLKTLDSTRCDIPEDLQDYWKANKERLGLKGAFLPDDSKLQDYI
jgi:hypothetical protein